MFNFNKTFDLIMEDIIQSVTPVELKERQKEYGKIRLKLYFDKLFKENEMIKNNDGSYNVNDDVIICGMELTSLKNINYTLNHIRGHFDCSDNYLRNLTNCPKIVDYVFDCSNNYLRNLIGAPARVETFKCYKNKLTSLEGCSKIINGCFLCYENNLTNLIGCPNVISGVCDFDRNNLTSLKGCPKEVGGNFYCSNNYLTGIEDFPKNIKGNLYVKYMRNGFLFKEEDIRKVCKVGGKVFV